MCYDILAPTAPTHALDYTIETSEILELRYMGALVSSIYKS